jgi:geranylgeranyl reductase family protein
MFDVIVAGAGPAGSVAAAVLARGGARVLLVDRARFPRSKLCGDTINPGALAVLRRLGMSAAIERSALPLEGMVVTGERGAGVRCAYGDGVRALAIVRRELDAALLSCATEAGARFEDGVIVRAPIVDDARGRRVRGLVIAGRGGRDVRIPAPMVIAADGRRSRLALALGLARQPPRPRRWAVGAYFAGVEELGPFGEMHVRRGRYLGIAPVPGGLANVCLVTEDRAGDARQWLLDTVARDRDFRGRFARASLVGAPVVIGPLAVDAPSAGIDGLLLAGDAAGFIDPMTGDGLRFAFRGGELAAAAALAALHGRLRYPHEQLARERRREFAAKWRFNRALRRMVSAGLPVRMASHVATAAPWVVRSAIRFAADIP